MPASTLRNTVQAQQLQETIKTAFNSEKDIENQEISRPPQQELIVDLN